MRKILFILFIIISVTLQAETNQKYTAMLLNLNGQGVMTRQNKDSALVLPLRFMEGDVLSLSKGTALVLLFSGEEIVIQAGVSFTIPQGKPGSNNQLSTLANAKKAEQSIFAQSGRAYSIRGKSHVFPVSSKILDTENVILRLKSEKLTSKASIKLIDELTQKVVLEKHALSGASIALSEAPLVAGNMYYWKLNMASNTKPEMGTIVMASTYDLEKVSELGVPKTHAQYLNAISTYYSNQFYFAAYATIYKAKQQFPDVGIYDVFLSNLLQQ